MSQNVLKMKVVGLESLPKDIENVSRLIVELHEAIDKVNNTKFSIEIMQNESCPPTLEASS
jgi:hypothetical protein